MFGRFQDSRGRQHEVGERSTANPNEQFDDLNDENDDANEWMLITVKLCRGGGYLSELVELPSNNHSLLVVN